MLLVPLNYLKGSDLFLEWFTAYGYHIFSLADDVNGTNWWRSAVCVRVVCVRVYIKYAKIVLELTCQWLCSGFRWSAAPAGRGGAAAAAAGCCRCGPAPRWGRAERGAARSRRRAASETTAAAASCCRPWTGFECRASTRGCAAPAARPPPPPDSSSIADLAT